MITGVWLSPDEKQVAVQLFEDAIVVVDESGERIVETIPDDWKTLHGDD